MILMMMVSRDGSATKDFKQFIMTKNQEFGLKGRKSKFQNQLSKNGATKDSDKDDSMIKRCMAEGERGKNRIIFCSKTSLEMKAKEEGEAPCCEVGDIGEESGDGRIGLNTRLFPDFGIKNKFSV